MKEYLYLIILFFKNPLSILEGVLNNIRFRFLSEEKQLIILKRRNICKTCPFMSKNYISLGLYSTIRKDEHCSICKCNIIYKTSCLSCNCGIETYNKNNNIPLELKWKSIIK